MLPPTPEALKYGNKKSIRAQQVKEVNEASEADEVKEAVNEANEANKFEYPIRITRHWSAPPGPDGVRAPLPPLVPPDLAEKKRRPPSLETYWKSKLRSKRPLVVEDAQRELLAPPDAAAEEAGVGEGGSAIEALMAFYDQVAPPWKPAAPQTSGEVAGQKEAKGAGAEDRRTTDNGTARIEPEPRIEETDVHAVDVGSTKKTKKKKKGSQAAKGGEMMGGISQKGEEGGEGLRLSEGERRLEESERGIDSRDEWLSEKERRLEELERRLEQMERRLEERERLLEARERQEEKAGLDPVPGVPFWTGKKEK
jgi:hypothetical protein